MTVEVKYYAETTVSFLDEAERDGFIILLPEAEKDKIALLQEKAGITRKRLAGAVFPALIVDGEFRTTGMMVIQMPNLRFYLKSNLAGDPEGMKKDVGEITEVIEALAADDASHETAFFIFDGMYPKIASFMNQIYLHLADRVEYGGVNAGSETFQPMPVLFDSERTVASGVLVIMMEQSSGAILEHGYKIPGELVAATSTDGNRIMQIDWKPAFTVYAEYINMKYGKKITRENFYELAVHFPLGIIRANDEVLVRIPVALNEDGSIYCVGEIPPNSLLTMLSAPALEFMDTVNRLAERIKQNNFPGNDLFLFYCAGRKMHLQEGALVEMADLAQKTGKRIYGALSLGEIGSTVKGGYPSFHNATLVCSPVEAVQ